MLEIAKYVLMVLSANDDSEHVRNFKLNDNIQNGQRKLTS